EPRRQQPHEAGEANEINPVRLELAVERPFERLAVLAEGGVIDDYGRDALLAGTGEPLCVRAIRHDERDFGRVVLRFRSFDQRHHVRAAARNENGNALSSHAPYQDRSRCPRNSARDSPDTATTSPNRTTVSPPAANSAHAFSAALASSTATMPTPQ